MTAAGGEAGDGGEEGGEGGPGGGGEGTPLQGQYRSQLIWDRSQRKAEALGL